MAERICAELPPELAAAVKSALQGNANAHAALKRSKHPMTKKAYQVARTLHRARRGDAGPALELTRKIVAASPSPVLSGKAGAKLKKGFTAPLKLINTITHSKKSPIRKAELALQKGVKKVLPFTKPFIDAHNKLAAGTQKVIKKATNAKGAKVNLKAAAAIAAKAKTPKAKAAAKKLKSGIAALNKLSKAVANAKALSKGTYKVTLPTGKTVNVPAEKVLK
jgi:hypothetical protein